MYRTSFFRHVAMFFLVPATTIGCGGASPPPPTTKPKASEQPVQAAAPDDGRWHHFWIVRQAVDAVMRGDLKGTQTLLSRMANGDFGEQDIEPDWVVYVEDMQDDAVVAQRARGLRRVAEQVAAIASRCGDCHREVTEKPERPERLGLKRLETMAHGSAGAKPAQPDHRWAADELWIGLTIPIHQAWVRGSRALIDSPLHQPPADEGESEAQVAVTKASRARKSKRAPDTQDLLDEAAAVDDQGDYPTGARGLQALVDVGSNLLKEGQPLPMAKVYADYIARCSTCHQDK